jgi:hypothetical protein
MMYASSKVGETLSPQVTAMLKLGMSEEEIQQVLADDKRIDKGEKLFELTAEQEKASKDARKTNRAPAIYKLDNTNGKRNKKVDTTKAEIMQKLLDCFDEYEPQVINAEREFTFTYNERKFKIVLSAPRS